MNPLQRGHRSMLLIRS